MSRWMAGVIVLVACTGAVQAQTSSLGARQREARAEEVVPPPVREAARPPRNAVYEQYSWTTAPPPPPKTFKPGDLLTIVVRQQRSFKAESELETEREWDLRSEIDAFFKLIDGGLGAANFSRGRPDVAYRFRNQLESEGETEREDRFTTRLTGRVLDVKPNGVLVIEGRAAFQHDEEISVVTIVGKCRKDDVSADNTVLSTQLADLAIVVSNKGALRAAAQRGWIPKIIDLLRPI